MRLILLTRAMESSAEVLPSLALLPHHVRIMPAEPTALLAAPEADALLVDGRRDLPAVRGLTRLLRQTGVEIPVIVVTTERASVCVRTCPTAASTSRTSSIPTVHAPVDCP